MSGHIVVEWMQRSMFQCCPSPDKGGGWSSWSSYGPCDPNCEKTRQRFCFERNMKVCPGADEYGIATEYKSCSKSECGGKMRRALFVCSLTNCCLVLVFFSGLNLMCDPLLLRMCPLIIIINNNNNDNNYNKFNLFRAIF